MSELGVDIGLSGDLEEDFKNFLKDKEVQDHIQKVKVAYGHSEEDTIAVFRVIYEVTVEEVYKQMGEQP